MDMPSIRLISGAVCALGNMCDALKAALLLKSGASAKKRRFC
jgi:hypothetical protein